MARERKPIKAIFGESAPIDDYQFIADAARTLTVRCFDKEGKYVETLALAIPTTPVTAKELAGGKLGKHWWWQVKTISAGTIYCLPSSGDAIDTTNGLSLTALDKLGPVPGTGAVIQSIESGETITVTGVSTLAEQQTQTTHLSQIETAVEVLSASDGAQATSLALLDDGVSTTGSAVPAKGFQATGTDGTNARALKTDTSGELQIDVLSIAAGTNAIGKLAANSGVDIGDVDVTSIAAGANLIGDVGVAPRTSGGLTTFMASGSDGSSILVATAQVVKASAGQLYGWYLYNPEAAVTFVHFYNVAAASVTVGTTNPLFTFAVPAGAAANQVFPIGIVFSNAGWSVAATTTAGGNTAPATGVSAVIFYA